MISRDEIRQLRQDLRDAGVMDGDEGRTWRELALLLTVFSAAVVGALLLPSGWLFLMIPAAAIAMTSAVMLGHEGGHGALSTKKWRNELMLYLTFPLLGGVSAGYWKAKHNVLHHGQPNVVGRDEDLNLWPMASNRAAHDASGPFLRWFQRRLQGFFFWPLTAFLTWSMRWASVAHLIGDFRRGRRGASFWLDVAAQVAHYAIWIAIPAAFVGFLPALGFYLAVWGLIGVFLSAIFVPAHLGLPLVTTFEDGWLLQLQTTRNLRMPRWLSWFFMGLDHQVEHHLLPRLGHRELRRAAVVVRAWAERIGAPYQDVGYGKGLAEVTRLMFRAWNLEAAPANQGAPPQALVDRAA